MLKNIWPICLSTTFLSGYLSEFDALSHSLFINGCFDRRGLGLQATQRVISPTSWSKGYVPHCFLDCKLSHSQSNRIWLPFRMSWMWTRYAGCRVHGNNVLKGAATFRLAINTKSRNERYFLASDIPDASFLLIFIC